MSLVAIALALSFVVHDVELTHEHPFAPSAHSHEQQGNHQEESGSAFSVYTHSDRKDFLALLLLIAAIPLAQLIVAVVPLVTSSRQPRTPSTTPYDYQRLLFRRGILNSKRY